MNARVRVKYGAHQKTFCVRSTLLGFYAMSRGHICDMMANGRTRYEGEWPTFGNGDIVKIVLDCEEWKMEAWLNGEKKAWKELKKNQKYHPIIGTGWESGQPVVVKIL